MNPNQSKRGVLVFGATGSQGRSVVEALVHEGQGYWFVRAVVKNKMSARANFLYSLPNVEVVDMNLDKNSFNVKYLENIYAIFLVTMPEYKGISLSEFKQGKMIVDAALKAGVQHIIFSTLPSIKKESASAFSVTHFDDKAQLADYIRTLPFSFKSFPMPAAYFTNFQKMTVWHNEQLYFNIPDCRSIAGFDPRDMGRVVVKLLSEPEKWNGIEIPIVAEQATPEEFIKIFNKVTGIQANLNLITLDSLPKNVASAKLGLSRDLMEWQSRFGYFGNRDLFLVQKLLGTPLTSFEKWLQDTKWKGEPMKDIEDAAHQQKAHQIHSQQQLQDQQSTTH